MSSNEFDLAVLLDAIDGYRDFLRTIDPLQSPLLAQKAALAEKYLLSARAKVRASPAAVPDFTDDELRAILQALLSMREDVADDLDNSPSAAAHDVSLTLQASCNRLLRYLRKNYPAIYAE